MHRHSVIHSRQIKAARALLDWSQEKLAKVSSLSIATVRKLEVGNISPRGTTNTLIRRAFEGAGLEFIEPFGVRQRPEEITVFQGEEGARDFWDDVYETSQKMRAEIVQVWPTLRQMTRLIGDYKTVHAERMLSLKEDVPVKCILTEDNEFLPFPGYVDYRFLSSKYIDSVQFYVYGDKYAVIPFSNSSDYKIIVIQSREASASFRRQFHSMWDRATPLAREQTAPKKVARGRG